MSIWKKSKGNKWRLSQILIFDEDWIDTKSYSRFEILAFLLISYGFIFINLLWSLQNVYSKYGSLSIESVL